MYYIIFVFLSIIAFAEPLRIKVQQKVYILIGLWLFLAFFAGLRYGDQDWDAYYSFYEEIVRGVEGGSVDVGFNWLCSFLSVFSSNPIFMFVAVACISVALNLNSFRKYSPYFLLCVLYYFVHLYLLKEMIQIRVGLASAICIYTIRFLPDHRFKSFWGIWLIALSIHLSTIVWILVGILYKIQPSVRMLKRMLLVCLLIGLFFPLGQYIKLFAGNILGRLDAYIAYGDSSYASELGIFTNINTLKSLILSVLFFMFYQPLCKASKYFEALLYAYIAGVCWLIVFNDFAIIGARMSNILLSVEPILVSLLIVLFSRNSRWIYVVLFIIVAFIMLTLNIESSKVTPYQFYFL